MGGGGGGGFSGGGTFYQRCIRVSSQSFFFQFLMLPLSTNTKKGLVVVLHLFVWLHKIIIDKILHF